MLADAGELMDRHDKLTEAIVGLLAAVSSAGGGPWEGRLDLTEEALTDWMCDQDDRAEELKGRIERKQRELVRLAEVEEEEETPLRSQEPATAATTPRRPGLPVPGSRK